MLSTASLRTMLATVVAVLLVAGPALAFDQIERKSTKTATRGKITSVSRIAVTIKPSTSPALTVPANEIVSIRWDGEPSKLLLGRAAERTGRFETALKTYNECDADPKATGDIKTNIQFLIARATAGAALAGNAKLDEARDKLVAFLKRGGDHFRYFDAVHLLGRVELARGKHDEAQVQFELLAKAPWTDYQLAARSAKAQLLLAKNQLAQAQAEYQAVIDASRNAKAPAEIDQRNRAILGKATCLIRQKSTMSYEQALKDLDGVLNQASEDNTAVLAEGYLRRGECLRLMARSKEAVLAYLHVDLVFSSEKDLHAEALFQLASLWNTVGKPDRAADARDRLRESYPESSWTKQLGN